MKKVLIMGATGMVGRLVLQRCLEHKDIEKIVVISRKSLGIHEEKLTEVIHKDFENFDLVNEYLKNIDVCFYCIGVYTGTVSKAAFRKITVDYTRAFAEAFRRSNDDTTFCFLSGAGADSSEKSKVLFAREKGKAENILLTLNFSSCHIFRPGYIYPVNPRKEPNFAYAVMRTLYKPVSKILPNFGVTSVELADKMVETAMEGSPKVVFENSEIREL